MINKIIYGIIAVSVIAAGLYFGYQKTRDDGQPSAEVNEQSTFSCASESSILKLAKSDLGDYFTDKSCKTLYVSSADANTQSACYNECAETWMPFAYDSTDLKTAADPLTKRLNVLKRTDGSYQYAYGDKPLYYYSGDAKPGDRNGDGMNNRQWSIILADQTKR